MDQQHRLNMGMTFSGSNIMTEIQVHKSGNAKKSYGKMSCLVYEHYVGLAETTIFQLQQKSDFILVKTSNILG